MIYSLNSALITRTERFLSLRKSYPSSAHFPPVPSSRSFFFFFFNCFILFFLFTKLPTLCHLQHVSFQKRKSSQLQSHATLSFLSQVATRIANNAIDWTPFSFACFGFCFIATYHINMVTMKKWTTEFVQFFIVTILRFFV